MLSFLNEDYAKVCLLPTNTTSTTTADHISIQSEQELTLAFYNCHIEARNNRECALVSPPLAVLLLTAVTLLTRSLSRLYRRILTYLIPLRILRGHLPSRELLDKFPVLDELYTPFIDPIRRGDIKAFDTALDKWERRLVDLNLWLTLERGRELCIRGLFRRV